MTGPNAGPDEMPPMAPVEDVEVAEEKASLVVLDSNVGALTATERAQIDMQVSTAKQYPRSITKALQDAESLACLDEETAESMLYGLKRGGKVIEGPSVRLAEIMAYSWSNLRVDADIVGEDREFVTAMALCWDLEKNVGIRIRVKRRITNNKNVRFNTDMIGVTSNAALSIAVRNAIFKVIPHSLTNRIYRKARVASLGQGGTLTGKRQKLVEYFGKMGVRPEEIFAVLEVKGLDDIMEDQLVTLRGLANAIKEGEQSVETVFRTSATKSAGAQELNEALSKKPEPVAVDPSPESSGSGLAATVAVLREVVAESDKLTKVDAVPFVDLTPECIRSVDPKAKRCTVIKSEDSQTSKVVHTPRCPHYK